MGKQQGFTVEEFQSYQVLCEFGARLFLESPQEELIFGLMDQRALLEEAPFSDVSKETAHELSNLLGSITADHKKEFFAEVHRDYSYLFYMVGVSHTSPFESVYRTDDRTMFGPTTLEVREAYRVYGVEVAGGGGQPDDHFGLELAYLAELFLQAGQALESGENNRVEQIIESVKNFLSAHLLVFAPVYLKNVQTRAQSAFYRISAKLMLEVIQHMAQVVGAEVTEGIDESVFLLDE